MEKTVRNTESYLFDDSGKQFRRIPFYELSIEEWVVYEKGIPKYLIDFNRKNKPLIQDFRRKMQLGEELESIVWELGRFLSKEWTTKHNITGVALQNSQQQEVVELTFLDDLGELFIDLTFVADDQMDLELLADEDKLLKSHLADYVNGYWGLESAFIDSESNLNQMMLLLFGAGFSLNVLSSKNDRKIIDLTAYKQSCISTEQLDRLYPEWLKLSERENSMNEYGNFVSIIGFVERNLSKTYLMMIAEKRKHLV